MELMVEHNIHPSDVWNMDQVGVFYELIPEKVVAPVGAKFCHKEASQREIMHYRNFFNWLYN